MVRDSLSEKGAKGDAKFQTNVGGGGPGGLFGGKGQGSPLFFLAFFAN